MRYNETGGGRIQLACFSLSIMRGELKENAGSYVVFIFAAKSKSESKISINVSAHDKFV
jgi:hypothetical protein